MQLCSSVILHHLNTSYRPSYTKIYYRLGLCSALILAQYFKVFYHFLSVLNKKNRSIQLAKFAKYECPF